jgi:hypothetical protein
MAVKAINKKAPSKIDMSSRPAKFFLAKKQGSTGREALKLAGYGDGNNSTQVEKSQAYKEIKEYFKDNLLEEITLKDISLELKKNIVQDQDKGAKNTAIKLALDKIEPTEHLSDDEDRVLVVLRPIKTIEATQEDKVIDVETE